MKEYKKILVTGADGFIGSHLTELLLSQGYNVKALAYYNSFNYWGWLEDIPPHPNLEIVTGDIRDPFFCNTIAKDVDAILHLAALIAIPYSYHAPQSYVETNVMGTLNICQAALNQGVKKIIVTSTSEVYGTAQYVPIDEKHPLQPQSPYSATKIGADAIALSFFHSFDLPLVIARPFNTFGPRQSARAVIPNMIVQLLHSNTVKIGDVTPTRDFTYVKDTCKGFLYLLEKEVPFGEVFNIGSNFEISILDIFNLLTKIMGKTAQLQQEKQRMRPEKSEVKRLYCNNKKIMNATGFTLDYSFEKGLEETVQWFSDPNNLKKYKHEIYNV